MPRFAATGELSKDEHVPSLTLAKPEMLFLAGYLRQLTRWNPDAAVRVQSRGNVAGFYGGPLDAVITLISLPLATPVDEFDSVVSAGRLRDLIGDVRALDAVTNLALPDATTLPPILGVLPPSSGWSPPFMTTAGDLAAKIDPQISALTASAEVLPVAHRDNAIRERWATPEWSALPFGMLHAARAHGFLNLAPVQVGASTNGPWKRLLSPAGQVFARVSDGLARLLVVKN